MRKSILYKIIMCIILISILPITSFLFYGDKFYEVTNKYILEEKKLENEEKIDDEEKSITLDEGLELLYSDEENPYVYYFVADINNHNRRVRNVSFEGEFNYLDVDCLHLKNVKTKNEIFDDIKVPYRFNEFSDMQYLKDGDKVEIKGTIIKGSDDLAYRTDYAQEAFDDKFYVLNEGFVNDKEDKITIKANISKNDEILEKYLDKEKLYDENEFIYDYLKIFSENYHRGKKIFEDVKFEVEAKCVDYIKHYTKRFLKYDIKTNMQEEMQKEIVDDNLKTTHYVYAGEGEYVISTNSLIISYPEEDEENAIIEYSKEKNKNFRKIVFKVGYKNDFEGSTKFEIVEDEDSSTNYENNENDNQINLGDIVHISNYDFVAIEIDENNPNKILLMMINSNIAMPYSDKEICYWQKSDVRKYLNTEFINEFGIDDKKRIHITENDNNIKERSNKVDTKALDKIFVLSREEIEKNNLFVKDIINESAFIRNQDFSLTKAMIVRPINLSYYGRFVDTPNLYTNYYVYPCMWYNNDKNLEMTDNEYKLEEEKYNKILENDYKENNVEVKWKNADFEVRNKRIVLGKDNVYVRKNIKKNSEIGFQKIIFGKRYNTKNNMQDMYWDVIDVVGNKAYLMTNQIIDVMNVDYKLSADENNVNYEDSNIKNYLENDFYNYAFNEKEKEIIEEIDLDYAKGKNVTLPNIDFIRDNKINMKIKEEGLKITKYAKEKYKFIGNNNDEEITGYYLYDTCINKRNQQFYEDKKNNGYNTDVLEGLSIIKTLYNQYGIDNNGVIRDSEVNFGDSLFYINELGIVPLICVNVEKYNNMYDEDIVYIDKNNFNEGYNLDEILNIGNMEWKIVDFQDNYARVIMNEEYDYGDVLKGELTPILWENSKLRNYLNNDFYENKFNDEEKSMIMTVENNNYKKDYVESRNIYILKSKTLDKIFIEGHDEYELDTYYGRGYLDNYGKEKIKPTMWIDLKKYKK